MHEKERASSFTYSTEALPQAQTEYMKEEVRPYGRTSANMPFGFEMVVVFRWNDLLALC